MSAHVFFGVLGPLIASVDDHPVNLGGPRQRKVLGCLVAARGRIVSVERLMAQVWDDTVPPTPATLFGYIAGLRRALEPRRAARTPAQVLVREGPGYALRAPAAAVDAERFTALVMQGDRAASAADFSTAATALDEALGLWRGAAYADFVDADFAVAEIARLDALHVAAREQRLAVALSDGEHQRVLGDLEALVAEQPLRERGWELLALALYRTGRQGDALAVLRRAREQLIAELGVDPGPQLRRMEAAVLSQDVSLEMPRPSAVRTPVLAPLRSNIPAALSSFVGRQRELVVLRRALAEHRLVTLTGAGGVGKTRLVLEHCRTRTDVDGPWLVELASLRDPTEVPRAVSDVLGLTGVATAGQLAQRLVDREAVLVVDNAEHLVHGVADLARTVLGGCPGLRLLVTSRQPLGVPGEAVLELLPLPLTEAVELLVDRINTANLAVGAGEPDSALAARVCRDLDGLPLAIELAAAQCRMLSLREIAFQLDDRLGLLTTGNGEDEDRHAAVRNAIGWSYQLLTGAEQALLRQLSVFDGGFDLDAARQVGAGPDLPEPVPALLGLARKSLVIADAATVPRRYRMLELVREYAADLLTGAERAQALARHRRWLLGLVETGEQRLPTADGSQWLRRLSAERDNIRAALVSALAAGEDLTAARICGALAWFWYRTGQIAEGERWGGRTLAALDARRLAAADPIGSGQSAEWTLARARLLMAVGGCAYLSGDHAGSVAALSEAAQLCARVAARQPHTTAAIYLASVTAIGGDVAGALSLADEAVRLADLVGEPWAQAEALTVRSQLSRACGDLARARDELARANELARSCGHQWAILSSGWMDGKVSTDLGEPDRALRTLADLAREIDPEQDRSSWLALVHSMAGALGRTGRAGTGAVLLGAVEALGKLIGYHPEQMDPHDGPGNRAAVAAALDPQAYQTGLASGRQLSWSDLADLVADEGRWSASLN
ncbi:BTAD domain-containing putative transcriptional regulator [Micromonospora sp. NPDC051196]|uniref:BTAD domain-containing putative transcriptional regulator n=1 Tax=Micromonospora sp. NPDC051196 TaxID=3155281 RepID=UPI003438F004